MKVALLSLNYLPSTGGLVSYLKNVAEELVRLGHKVTIFCAMERNSNCQTREIINGVEIIRINVLNISLVKKVFTPYIISHKFKKYFIENPLDDFDIVISRHVYLAYALVGLDAMKKSIFIAPLISSKLVSINSNNTKWIEKVYLRLLSPQLSKIESTVIKSGMKLGVLSKSKQKEFSVHYGISTPVVLLPGINSERFYPKHKNDNDIEDVTIVTVCRLVEEKNISMLISALSILKQKNKDKNIVLKIVGDGPLRDELQKQVKDSGLSNFVDFVGFVTNPEEFYQNSDVFVLPSIYEGFGHVYIEANACGIPCIGLSTNIPSVITACDEIIEDNINGFLTYENSDFALASAVQRFIDSELSREEWCNQCVQYVNKKYSWEKHFDNIVNALNEH